MCACHPSDPTSEQETDEIIRHTAGLAFNDYHVSGGSWFRCLSSVIG